MDRPTVCPRLDGVPPVIDKTVLSAERELNRLSLTAGGLTDVHEDGFKQALGRSVRSGLMQPPGRSKPPLSPKLAPSSGRRKRFFSDEFTIHEASSTASVREDLATVDDNVQLTPTREGRESPAKMARSASLGRFTSMSNLAAFEGAALASESGPPKATVRRPHITAPTATQRAMQPRADD
jgi:hypothetical protein